ncbi:MAG: two-component regulator propeller domain-containing protein [Chryseolinea sp.]
MKLKALLRLIRITLGLAAFPAFGQLPLMQFETITTRDGLPSNTVLSALQDKAGFMWFGTRLCPVRYDGTSFRTFLAPQSNLVSGLGMDSSNNIWLASDPNGIMKIEAATLEMTHVLRNAKDKETGFFYVDKQNRGWYSDFHGVNRVDLTTQQYKHYPFRQTTYAWTKASFVEDSEGTLWVIGRDNGLFRYDPVNDTLICEWGADSADPSRREDVILSKACAGSDGFLWIASVSHGLIKYDTKNHSHEKFFAGRENPSIFSVTEGTDENGKRILWIGHQDGLGIFRPGQNRFYYFTGIFPVTYEVNDIYRNGKDGVVWISTSEGVIKYHPKSNLFQSISLPPSILGSSIAVNAVIQDKFSSDEIYYLGLSHNGMLRWERNTGSFSLIEYPETNDADTRWMIQRDDGKIWIGTSRWDYQRPGIFVYDPNTQKFISTNTTQSANKKFSVPFFKFGGFDLKGRFWIGNSDEGVRVFNESGKRETTPWSDQQQKALLKENNLLTDLLITRAGKVLLGTSLGVMLADESEKKFISIDTNIPDSVTPRAVNSLLEDKLGNIWAARWGGLTEVSASGALLNIFTTEHGFHDQECSGLVEDDSGNIWMGNYEGLYCISPITRRIIRFTVSDGLISNNTTRRIFMSNDGKNLIVGHKNGFNFVNVSNLLNPIQAPELAISSFKVHEKLRSVDVTKPIRLERTDNSFSVDFVALNYRKHQDNQYAYYLEGLDKDWNYIGTRHLAYYTNLSPGSYTLHLKAGDSFGNWNQQTIQMNIEVIPAFYETWWFRSAIFLIFVTVLYASYRFRVNQLLRLQRMRNRISADLHDELGSSLSSISIMGNLAQKKLLEVHPSAHFVARIVEEVQHMSGSLDDIIWNISPKNDALSSMMARMTRYASEIFEAKQIIYKVMMPEQMEEITLSIDQRRNLYLIFKESVNNIVKHSHCVHAKIELVKIEKNLSLIIEDDGAGFNQSKQNDRNGLVNLKDRAQKLQGTMQIVSSPGKGTVIQLVFPLRPHHPKGLLNFR